MQVLFLGNCKRHLARFGRESCFWIALHHGRRLGRPANKHPRMIREDSAQLQVTCNKQVLQIRFPLL